MTLFRFIATNRLDDRRSDHHDSVITVFIRADSRPEAEKSAWALLGDPGGLRRWHLDLVEIRGEGA